MRYSVQLEGFENQAIEVNSRGLFRNAIIIINGSPASTKNKGEFILKRDDGAKVIARVNQSFFHDAPSIQIEGKTIQINKPLAWYQYLLGSALIIFVFIIGEFVAFGMGYQLGLLHSFAIGMVVFVIVGLFMAFVAIELINANIKSSTQR